MNEEKIRKIAENQGIDLIGFFSVAPLSECLSHLEKRVEQGFSTGFEGGTPQERIDYLKHFSKAKSGIVIGVNYYQSIHRPDDETSRGAVAAVVWGRDYHEVLREKMRALMDTLNQDQIVAGKPKIGYEAYVDNSPLVDRGSAYRAGLGFFGKNNCLINKTLGSYFFIGQILVDTDIEFSSTAAIENGCGDCRRCLDACPHNALGDGFSLDPSKCVAFLTQKKELTPDEEKRISTYLYGCDLCQQACPYNQELEKTKEERFWTDDETAYPKIEALLKLSNKEFKNQFGKTAAGWRGKKIMVRNAKLFEKNKK
ncbi:tRNA epoxyqueuosine(34) reductase QueG [Acetobacterium bakii]|uniref:tRNA epoxyqueuosine(34) reductase QueG n=1 Tax=Acetobacterium bakii TaxID=52689 RepID=UPI000683421E|nr:tRNA epoxyqueuosine(34) reductase QueG [Acetobacterium bakii]